MQGKNVSSGRSITSTNISFGLAKIPVSISTLVDKIDGASLSGVCPHCKDSIGNIATCKGCSTVFTSNRDPTLLKAYKYSDDEQVIISAEQRENLKNFDSQILVQGSIPIEEIDSRYFTGGYYLTPQKSKKKTDNTKAYLTIFEGLRLTNTAMVVKYSVRSKQNLGLIIAQFDESTNTKALVIKEICYGEQLRVFDLEFPEDQIPNETEEQAGMAFINNLPSVKPQDIVNDFTVKFEEILKNPDQVIELETPVSKGSVMDMFAIQA
jgi:non-homologous end joining protein Ku